MFLSRSAAQVRRGVGGAGLVGGRAGAEVRGRRPNGDCASSPSPPPPQRPQARAAGARARRSSPPPAPTGRRAWPCPRSRRARAAPNGHAGRERAAAAARAPECSRGPGAPRGELASFSRPHPHAPSESFPGCSSSLIPDQRRLLWGGGEGGHESAMRISGLGKQKCCPPSFYSE